MFVWLPILIIAGVMLIISLTTAGIYKYSYDKRNRRVRNRAGTVLNTNNALVYTVPTTRQVVTMQQQHGRQQLQQRLQHEQLQSTSRPPSYTTPEPTSPMANPGGGGGIELPPSYDQAVIFSPSSEHTAPTTTESSTRY